MERDKIEALESIQSALDGNKYTGDYLFIAKKGDDTGIYCVNEKISDGAGKLIALIWKETQAGIDYVYIDMSPGVEGDLLYVRSAQETIEKYISDNGFTKELEIADIWASWRKQISSSR